MNIATIYIPYINTVELATIIKELGENSLHANVNLVGKNWVIEVTQLK